MKHEELLIQSITNSATEVFSTMLGAEITAGAVSSETSAPEANDGVVSFIGLAGTWAGTGSLTCSPVLACRICAQMLMTEATSVNEEVLDAVAELTNMIIGGVKTQLEESLGPLGLSIPTVVYGRNFKTKSAGSAEWIVIPFSWDDELMVVKMFLAPNEKHPIHAHGMGHTCPLEV